MYLGPFGKGVPVDHLLELFPGHEKIVVAMHLSRPGVRVSYS